MTIGECIRIARKNAGLTQAQLAQKSGVAAISIHQYESGKRQPQLEQLIRISSALNLDLLEITGIESDMSKYKISLINTKNGEPAIPGKKNYSIRDVYNLLSNDEKAEFWSRLLKPLHAQLNEAFDQLNDTGQREAVKRVKELAEIPRYQKEPEAAPQIPPRKEGDTSLEE